MDEKIPSYFLQVALRSIETEAEGQELFVLQASIAVTKAYWNQYNGETKEGSFAMIVINTSNQEKNSMQFCSY